VRDFAVEQPHAAALMCTVPAISMGPASIFLPGRSPIAAHSSSNRPVQSSRLQTMKISRDHRAGEDRSVLNYSSCKNLPVC